MTADKVTLTERLGPASLKGYLRRALAPWRDAPRARMLRDLRAANRLEPVPCALCGRNDIRAHFVYNGFEIVRCINDELIFVSPRPVDVAPYYDERYYTGGFPGLYTDYHEHARVMEGQWSARLERLETMVGRPGALLDVGAATGDFVALAGERGWTASGVELSAWASARARERGLNVTTGDIRSAPAGNFDAVTLWDCIEHLSDPAGTLRDAARLLRPGGVISISTGAVPHGDRAVSSGWYYPPWHLYYFSVETLSALCRGAGFGSLDVTLADEDTPYALMTVTGRLSRGAGD